MCVVVVACDSMFDVSDSVSCVNAQKCLVYDMLYDGSASCDSKYVPCWKHVELSCKSSQTML